ncbi:MAG: hypothetical protein OEX81_00460 [Candidatus Pacebacteria bacterium]|nr:hypothetical protein [Candidatus Paceibacterota bacterium]
MLSKIESFHHAHQAHRDWQIDRPLIDKFNRSELKVALGLLSGEIDELNGGDHTGIFTKKNFEKFPAIESDYRQQEISDIIVFAMTSFDEMGESINTQEIYAKAEAWSDAYSFNIVTPEDTTIPPEAFTDDQNKIYELLKVKLNEQAAVIAAYEGGETHGVSQALESILVYCVAMHSLLGVDSGKAIMEKIARNMIKYPAHLFQLPKEDMSPDELEAYYHKVRGECATEFDGPVMEQEVSNEDGSEIETIFDRPKTGTTEFYSPQQIIEYEHNPDEIRPIGIWYRAAAQVIATSYGISVKVSDLLNRNKKK